MSLASGAPGEQRRSPLVRRGSTVVPSGSRGRCQCPPPPSPAQSKPLGALAAVSVVGPADRAPDAVASLWCQTDSNRRPGDPQLRL